MASSATNSQSNSTYNICQYDPSGICNYTANSIKSFFEGTQDWAQTCSTKIQEHYFSDTPKDPNSTTNPAYNACIGPDTTIGKMAAAVSTVAKAAGPWVKTTLPLVFSLYGLPAIPPDIASGQSAEGPWAIAALAASVVVPYFLSSKIPTVSSLSSGGLLGAGVSLLFGQDPRIGALIGAVSKLTIDTVGNYATTPLKKIYTQAEKALKPYVQIANAIVTAGFVIGIGYHFNTLLELASSNPWTALTTLFSAGSQFHLLWTLYQAKGALSLAASVATFCISHIHYPVIAYLSLSAQSPSLHTMISSEFTKHPIAYTGAGIGALLITTLGHSLLKKAPTANSVITSQPAMPAKTSPQQISNFSGSSTRRKAYKPPQLKARRAS